MLPGECERNRRDIGDSDQEHPLAAQVVAPATDAYAALAQQNRSPSETFRGVAHRPDERPIEVAAARCKSVGEAAQARMANSPLLCALRAN